MDSVYYSYVGIVLRITDSFGRARAGMAVVVFISTSLLKAIEKIQTRTHSIARVCSFTHTGMRFAGIFFDYTMNVVLSTKKCFPFFYFIFIFLYFRTLCGTS